jgi:CubicO group peptidase (beta-lactamase class C family)
MSVRFSGLRELLAETIMKHYRAVLAAYGLLAAGVWGLCGCQSPYRVQGENRQTGRISAEMRAVLDRFREEIPRRMEQNNIPGFAIALVDNEGILWAAGFGFTDTDHQTPVTPTTIFSIQSMSKTFTGTAVMTAVRDGLLDLDVPITKYLPDFTVNSRFEEHPEQKMTLRLLLSHTAGFTHEAPVGNNFDTSSPSFEEHVRSISQTWLKFPVGQGNSYSNLGVDLAGYILQRVASKPLPEVMRERIFAPLDMPYSSMDMAVIRKNPNRAIGHQFGVERVPLEVPMLAAGGVYTNAQDLSRFVQFHLNRGRVNDKQILDENILDEMFGQTGRPPLAIGKGKNHDSVVYAHGGGGFGFLTHMMWYPEFGIGAIELTNSADHKIQGKVCEDLLNELIDKKIVTKRSTLPPPAPAKTNPPQAKPAFVPTPYKDEWKQYLGHYDIIQKGWGLFWWSRIGQFFGIGRMSVDVQKKDGFLFFDGKKLFEYKPGLFFTPDGEAVDFRGEVPTWRNLKLKKS